MTLANNCLKTLFSVENSKAMAAWSFISTALNHCQTMGYHRVQSRHAKARPCGYDEQRKMEISLFRTVLMLEKGLALRLGRPSGIRDSEMTLTAEPNEHRTTKIARIQGQVYNQLYSPSSLPAAADRIAQALYFANEVRDIIGQIKSEISVCLLTTFVIAACANPRPGRKSQLQRDKSRPHARYISAQRPCLPFLSPDSDFESSALGAAFRGVGRVCLGSP